MVTLTADVPLNLLYTSTFRPYRDSIPPLEIIAAAGETVTVPDDLAYAIQLDLGRGTVPGFAWVQPPSPGDLAVQHPAVQEHTVSPTFDEVEAERVAKEVIRAAEVAQGHHRGQPGWREPGS